MWPHDRSVYRLRLPEVTEVFQFPENAKIQKWRAIIDTTLTIGEFEMEFVT
jgi:hypothetical protein